MWLQLLVAGLLGRFAVVSSVGNKVDPLSIDKVHLVVSNHLDIGFTNLSATVVNLYFDDYFPLAAKVAQICNDENIAFNYTTKAYLISLYFDCPPNAGLHCPSDDAKNTVANSISKGWIVWDAFPFNAQMEYLDASLIEFGVSLSRKLAIDLDSTDIPTIISQRDVPGITQSIIPILTSMTDNDDNPTINAITIGVNDDSAPPNVPNIFQWRYCSDPTSITNQKSSDTSCDSIITMVHPGGYGNAESDYITNSVMISNFSEALIFFYQGDNHGPPTLEKFLSTVARVKEAFPNAEVKSSTVTSFMSALESAAQSNPSLIDDLPIVTGEMGDTWTYGPPSDPYKLAAARLLTRQRKACLQSGQCSNDDIAFSNFSRWVLFNGEHTFGGSLNKFLKNESYYAWSNEAFNAVLNNADMQHLVQSWFEQRNWGINNALTALQMSDNPIYTDLRQSLLTELENTLYRPQSPLETELNDWIIVSNLSQSFVINNELSVQFNADTGAILRLDDLRSGIAYIRPNKIGFGAPLYQTFSEQNFSHYFVNEYSYNPMKGCKVGFCKMGLNSKAPYVKYQTVSSHLQYLYQSKHSPNVFLTQSNLGENTEYLRQYYGAPQMIFTVFNFSSFDNNTDRHRHSRSDSGSDSVKQRYFDIQTTLIDKIATRIPEVIWFAFNPSSESERRHRTRQQSSDLQCEKWSVDKIDSNYPIDITDDTVVVNGTHWLHAINGRVLCYHQRNDDKPLLELEPIDATLASFMPMNAEYDSFSPFPTPLNGSVDKSGGVAFSLVNNIWGTNYAMWYPFDTNDANSTFRFTVYLN